MFIPTSRFSEQQLQDVLQAIHATLLEVHQLPVRHRYFQPSIIEHSLSTSTILRAPSQRLKPDEFRLFLSKRLPLVITHLNDALQLAWSPKHLTDEYGSEDCTMEDCEDSTNRVKTKIHHFLSQFNSDMNGTIWKVKVRWSSTGFHLGLNIILGLAS